MAYNRYKVLKEQRYKLSVLIADTEMKLNLNKARLAELLKQKYAIQLEMCNINMQKEIK